MNKDRRDWRAVIRAATRRRSPAPVIDQVLGEIEK
jgi:hypothetical protein